MGIVPLSLGGQEENSGQLGEAAVAAQSLVLLGEGALCVALWH